MISLTALLTMQVHSQTAAKGNEDDPDLQPPVTKADVRIVQRARSILNKPSQWNRADDRECPADATTFSLYCALQKATVEVTGDFQHRGAAMQQARFVIEEVAPNRNYHHRLMDYNNDATTTFHDVQKVLQLLEARVRKELQERPSPGKRN